MAQDGRYQVVETASPRQASPQPATRKATRGPEITLHQLRIFWTVAHADTLTKAAKQLGLAQPSLSQQLSKLETTAGTRLFDRRSNQMTLTEAGHRLMPKAELILRNMGELEDSLSEYQGGSRATIRLSGLSSILRVVLPRALQLVQEQFPDVTFDVHENAPGEVLELLNSRRVNIGIVAANSVVPAGGGLVESPIVDDPFVLAVPRHLNLDRIADPQRELPAGSMAVLNRSIQFIFGTQHSKRIEGWYDKTLPDHRVVAQCRSFEVALGLVRAGLGVCIAPALSAFAGERMLDGVRLYKLPATRKIVAIVPSQYRRTEPYASLLASLKRAGDDLALPELSPTPPFLKHSASAL